MNEKRHVKIIITNIVSLNPGDAAILSGMYKIFKRKYGSNCEIVVYDKSSEASSKYYPWANFRQSLFSNNKNNLFSDLLEKLGYGHWSLRLRYFKTCIVLALIKMRLRHVSNFIFNQYDTDSVFDYFTSDLIVSTGGTYLVENYGLWPAIYDYRLSLKTKTPLIFFTQSLGPYKSIKNQKQFKYIFTNSLAIFLRDKKSKGNLLEIGIPENLITLSNDAAFVLEPTSKNQERKVPGDRLKIAISVRSLRFFDDKDDLWNKYVKCIQSMTNFSVRELNADVTFLSTCQGISEYWTDDSNTADEICRTLPVDVRKVVTIDTDFRQPTEIINTYGSFDLVIATRMHAAILAIKARTPVIGIAYEFKMEELFHQLEMKEMLLKIESLDDKVAINILKDIINNHTFWKEYVTKKSKEYREITYLITNFLPKVNAVYSE